MAPIQNVFALLSYLFVYHASSFALDCSSNMHVCENTNIHCTEDEDCYIACNEERSCMYSTIICPAHADCTIECDGWQSCKDTVINATHSTSGNLNILCQGSTDHCFGITILGSTVYHNDGNMNLLCNGELQSCMHSHVRCPVSGNCLVSCNADKGCQYANITGPIHGDLTVDCNEDRSCFGAVLNGQSANQMDVSGCIAHESCFDLTLKCPANINRTAHCFIQGNDNIGSNTKLYAVNGWKDIQMAYSGQYGMSHRGTMFCGRAYDSECEIASNDWSCAEDTHYCNDVYYEETTLRNTIYIEGTLPPLTDSFENESMGMLLIVGGLIALAVGCILLGIIKHICSKHHKKWQLQKRVKGYQEPTKPAHRIEAIIDGDEPSYVDSKGNVHHQHPQHERKMSSLHDKF